MHDDIDRSNEMECDEYDGIRFFKGLIWGTIFSIPLWMLIFGGVKLIKSILI